MKVAITVDTEEEWDWDAGFPVREYDVTNISHLPRFHEMCQRYGLRPTYFVNHAVLVDDMASAVIHGFQRGEDCEIGMHCHPWNTPPIHANDNTGPMSFLENLPADAAREKLTTVLAAHHDRGFQPTSFRGGRYSSAAVTQQFLLQHGFVADASVCPYSRWPDPGAPDYQGHSGQPVPLATTEDGSGRRLWSLPLTRVFSRRPFALWNRWLTTIETTPLRRLRLIGILQSTGIIRRIWLNFETESAVKMLWLVRHAGRLQLPYLCFTVHSSSLSVGPSPYARTAAQVDTIFQGIEQVLQLLQSMPDMQPVTISQLAHDLERIK